MLAKSSRVVDVTRVDILNIMLGTVMAVVVAVVFGVIYSDKGAFVEFVNKTRSYRCYKCIEQRLIASECRTTYIQARVIAVERLVKYNGIVPMWPVKQATGVLKLYI